MAGLPGGVLMPSVYPRPSGMIDSAAPRPSCGAVSQAMQIMQAMWIRTQDGELVNIAGARRFTATDPDREGMVAIEVHFSDDGEEYDVIAIIPKDNASQVFE